VAERLPVRIAANCVIRKRRPNGFELLESMDLLAPAVKVVLALGVALKFVTSEVSQNHLFCFDAI
jgi:hypothetical protein